MNRYSSRSLSLITAVFFALGALGLALGAPPSSSPRSATPAATQPAMPFTMPSADLQPSRQAFSSWETAALFRLNATGYAAGETPLPADLVEKLARRIRKARADIDAVSTRYAAGGLRSAPARQSVDGVMTQLKADLAEMLGDRSAAFFARVDRTMGDAQLFSGSDPERGRLFLEASVKLNDTQKAQANSLLADAARRVRDIERANSSDMLSKRHDVGFATRSAVRSLLTPEQLSEMDGPFEAPAASARPLASTAPTTSEALTGLSEAQAIALTRLEALRYAVIEGPYSPQVAATLTDRIATGTARVKQAPSTAPASGFGADDERVGRIYASVLADTSKVLADASETSHDRAADLIRRQGRIYQDVTDLSTGEPWHGRLALESLKLSESQRSQVARLLAECVEQLRALDAKQGRSPLAIDPDAPTPRHPKEKYSDFFASDPTLGPAARSLRRRKVAFETRAALRDVLTPKQQAAWDAMESN